MKTTQTPEWLINEWKEELMEIGHYLEYASNGDIEGKYRNWQKTDNYYDYQKRKAEL